ncbi:DUF2752 domain-containing protein [Daejeonella sp.]|uniref:DUF2752 domain-containing protein n=1 Tax=Daejeonella sp. TaxID=2805397 RepID=UPI003983CC59
MLSKWPLEFIIWTAAILTLSISYPKSVNHFTLCPIENLVFLWCPGCGLGRSISYFLHGDVRLSLEHHWFGIPATGILIFRIVQLFNKFVLNLMSTTKLYNGKRSAH